MHYNFVNWRYTGGCWDNVSGIVVILRRCDFSGGIIVSTRIHEVLSKRIALECTIREGWNFAKRLAKLGSHSIFHKQRVFSPET